MTFALLLHFALGALAFKPRVFRFYTAALSLGARFLLRDAACFLGLEILYLKADYAVQLAGDRLGIFAHSARALGLHLKLGVVGNVVLLGGLFIEFSQEFRREGLAFLRFQLGGALGFRLRVGAHKHEIQRGEPVNALDVVFRGLLRRVGNVQLVANFIIAFNILPKRKAGFEVNVFHYRIRSHNGRANTHVAEGGAEHRAFVALDRLFLSSRRDPRR